MRHDRALCALFFHFQIRNAPFHLHLAFFYCQQNSLNVKQPDEIVNEEEKSIKISHRPCFMCIYTFIIKFAPFAFDFFI